MTTPSKAWNWQIVKDDHATFWQKPSITSFYLVERWRELGLTRLLDLGCGLGRHAILFGRHGFDVSCFDLSEDALERTREWAEKEGLHFRYRAGDILELPYPDDSFDSILCYNVISHTDTSGMRQIVSELQRILRPGGECYLTLGSKETWGWKETNQLAAYRRKHQAPQGRRPRE